MIKNVNAMLKAHAPRKFRSAIRHLMDAFLKGWFRYRAGEEIREYLATHEIRKLQIGAGWTYLIGWLNTDLNKKLDLIGSPITYLDATKEFPLPSCSLDYIFSEHFIEHISYDQAGSLLQECYRVLRPGGKIRITTPDLEFLIGLYTTNKTSLQSSYIQWVANNFFSGQARDSDTHAINNFFYGFEHQFIYDFKTLRQMLTKVGFFHVERCEVGESTDVNLENLESHGKVIGNDFNRLESMVVEATKG